MLWISFLSESRRPARRDKEGTSLKRSSFVSPEPERMRRKTEAMTKMAGDIFLGRKNPLEAIKEYKKEVKKIEAERRLDEWVKY